MVASDVSKRLVLWRLLLEYMNLIILRKIVRMCEQCVPGRIFRPGKEARDYEASEPRLLAREGVAPQDIHSYHGYYLCSYKASRSHV